MGVKKILYSLIVGITIFIGIDQVSATIYNGEGYSGNGRSPGGSCSGTTFNCAYNNTHHKTVKVSLYYFNRNQTRQKLGHSIYLTSKMNSASSDLGIQIDNMYEVSNLTYETAEQHFMAGDRWKNYISLMGVDPNSLNNETIDACTMNGAEYGYRVIIEPALTVYEASVGKYYLKTVKEIANTGGFSSKDRWDDPNGGRYSVAMITNCNDVGVSAVSPKGVVPNAIRDIDIIKSEHTGYGYNIIDIGEKLGKTCYKLVSMGSKAVCNNTDKRNEGIFRQEIQTYKVPNNSKCDDDDQDITSLGKLKSVKVGGNTCRFYCKEEAKQIFPGNISSHMNINIGKYLIWPTNEKTIATPFKNNYSLSFEGKLTCVLDSADNMNVCRNVNTKQLYNFETNASTRWDDGNGSIKQVELEKISNVNYKKDVNDSTRTITISAKVSYKIPDNFNRYVDKDGNSHHNNGDNYFDLKYGNLPVSSNASTNKKYNLQIINTKLGNTLLGNANGTFGTLLTNYIYTCNYEPTNNQSCICPSGTEHAGEYIKISKDGQWAYLSGEVVEENGVKKLVCSNGKMQKIDEDYIGCPAAQNAMCDSPENYVLIGTRTTTEETIDYDELNEDCVCPICPSGTLNEGLQLRYSDSVDVCNKLELTDDDYCPSNISNVCTDTNGVVQDLSPCTRSGQSIEYCRQQLCGKGPYKCKNTNGVGGEMDITACVYTKVGQGKTLQQAIDECDMVVCPIGGIRIIYRVIDLTNPFPSYNADATVTQANLHKGMFNDELKGRYPGTNWNSTSVVKEKILNNRNVDGDAVYSKTPLYTFVLDSNTIKQIRRYNDGTSYDDFNLKCKKNKSIACISSFVHNKAYGLTSGTCSGTITEGSFYKCDD